MVCDNWDEWFGHMTLKGLDPRRWDLVQLLAAFESAMQQSAKDEAEWNRTKQAIYAEPKQVRDQRRAEEAAGVKAAPRPRMSVDDAEAMLARFAASEARYG